MIILLIWVTVLVGVVVLYLRQAHSTFDRYGMKHHKSVPLVDDIIRMVKPKDHIGHDIANLYNSFPEERFVGRYEFLKEVILIRDVELLKKITIKDFDHFVDHSINGPESFITRSLFFLRGEEWKDMRTTLSPAFTSSKMRLMVPFMVEVGDHMIRSLKKKLGVSKDDYIDVDCKDLTTRYTNDVIASCAFGLKVDSHSDEDNKFYAMGKKIADFKLSRILLFILLGCVPYLLKILDFDFIPKAAQDFFRNLVSETMKERETRNIVRPDMIHSLMEAKKGKLSHDDTRSDDAAGFATVEESSVGKQQLNRGDISIVWKDDDLVAQAFLFFVAGFESISSSMSFLLHELAVNPDVQDRLALEIREHDAKNGGMFDFSAVQSMTYLDMVVSEVLRKWPPFVVLDRQCTKEYNLGKPNGSVKKDYILRKGAEVWIPTLAFHHDPEYYPEPHKFNPERFSEKNKHKINPMTYMPFGIGPRNCLGSRFALCEVKVMAYQLLRHIELSPCEKTCIPAKLSPDSFNLRLQGGHWLRFRLRK